MKIIWRDPDHIYYNADSRGVVLGRFCAANYIGRVLVTFSAPPGERTLSVLRNWMREQQENE